MKKPVFSEIQRKQLDALGMSERIVAAVERRVLPDIAAQAEPVKLGDIRSKLEDAKKHARSLLGCIERMQFSPGGREAFLMLHEAHTRDLAARHLSIPESDQSNCLDPDDLAKQIARFVVMTDESLAKLKGKQSRHRIAHPYPIRLLDDVLLEEWAAENEGRAGLEPYPFPVSRSEPSLFRQVVAICYEAAGHPTVDPDRAIRAHMEQEKASDGWLEALIEDDG